MSKRGLVLPWHHFEKNSLAADKTRSGLCTHSLNVDHHVPTRSKVTPTDVGAYDERADRRCELQPDRTDVMDRGYAKFESFTQIVSVNSSYVCRVRDNSVFEVLEKRAK